MAHAFTLTLDRQADAEWSIGTGSTAMPTLLYNNSALTPEEKADEHMGGRFLACAALACYTNSLWNDIKRANGKPISMRASIDVEKEKDSAMRTTFSHFVLRVDVQAENLSDADFETIRAALYRGSLVTYSMEEGMEFDYTIELTKS